jgi:hypothetical protein
VYACARPHFNNTLWRKMAVWRVNTNMTAVASIISEVRRCNPPEDSFALVKQSHNRPGQEVDAPRFHDSRRTKVVRFSTLRTGCLYPPGNTGLFEMIVGVLTTCHTQHTWDRSVCIFLFNRTTLQVFATYLTGALYVHLLWYYKHQHDNRVRSKLFVACQHIII